MKKDIKYEIDNEIFAPNEEDSSLVTPEEMKENFELIKTQIPRFKEKFTTASKLKTEITNMDINRIINESVNEANLNEADTRIIEGFYETWMSVFMMVGSDREALEIVFKMIHSQ